MPMQTYTIRSLDAFDVLAFRDHGAEDCGETLVAPTSVINRYTPNPNQCIHIHEMISDDDTDDANQGGYELSAAAAQLALHEMTIEHPYWSDWEDALSAAADLAEAMGRWYKDRDTRSRVIQSSENLQRMQEDLHLLRMENAVLASDGQLPALAELPGIDAPPDFHGPEVFALIEGPIAVPECVDLFADRSRAEFAHIALPEPQRDSSSVVAVRITVRCSHLTGADVDLDAVARSVAARLLHPDNVERV